MPHRTSNFRGPNGVGGSGLVSPSLLLFMPLLLLLLPLLLLLLLVVSSGGLTPKHPRTQSSRSASFALSRMHNRGDSVRSPVPNFIRQTWGGEGIDRRGVKKNKKKKKKKKARKEKNTE